MRKRSVMAKFPVLIASYHVFCACYTTEMAGNLKQGVERSTADACSLDSAWATIQSEYNRAHKG